MSDPITISFTVSNPLHLAGVDHARGLYNAALPPITNEDGTTSPAPGLTAEQYMSFIAFAAVGSWAKDKVRADWEAGDITKAQRDASIAAIDAIQP